MQVSDHGVFLGNGWRVMYIAGSVLPSVGGQANGTFYAFLIIAAFLVVAAVIAQFGIHTRGERLDVVPP